MTDAQRVDWLAELLSDHVRGSRTELCARTFPASGIQFKCGDGPWRKTLRDAVDAHHEKHSTRSAE